jgi:imidazolonepropionase-like amidohydrolase
MYSKTLLFAAAFLSVSSFAKQTIIHAGELLYNADKPPLTKQTIIIENDKIVAVKKGFQSVKNNQTLIDLSDSFVLPGLMDMHVHLQFELGPKNDSETLKMSAELVGMRSAYYAKKTLEAGFTTVRDLGSDPQYMYALRDAIDQGWITGPRIIAAGGVAITGGHLDRSGVHHGLLDYYAKKTTCDGPYDCRRATRHSIKYGADWIKVASTGGVLTDRATGTGQQMGNDELNEVVNAAQSMGRKVAAHAHQEDGIIAALQAGVASIEHGSYAGEQAYKLFNETGAYLVPTLLAGETVVEMANRASFMSPAIKSKALRVGTDMKNNFANAYKAGVNIAYGTDSGVSKHGTNAREAVLMVNSGMPAQQVIKTATINSAMLLGLGNQIGTIETGKYADIIATKTSPINDIEQLLSVIFVMRSGEVIKK